MLVLSRKENQEIHLPGLDVKIRVLSTGRSSVKLGIEAPRQTRILRGELNAFGEDRFSNSNEYERFEHEFDILQPH